MKPLTLEETALKEEMKDMCFKNGNYIDENAKAKFKMLCHLEDFEVQYWELQEENKQLKEVIDKAIDYIKKYNVYFADCYEDKKGNIYSRDVEFVEIIPNDLLKILKGGINDRS